MSTTYYFAEFRLDPAAHELWQGQELTKLPRRTFVGLVFLVEHRGRAISRDELIHPLWGRRCEATVVMPLGIDDRAQVGIGWLRPGALDLIAEHKRDTSLPVLPSESVISALHAATKLPELEGLSALRQTLRVEQE
jgi:hypothetical protein